MLAGSVASLDNVSSSLYLNTVSKTSYNFYKPNFQMGYYSIVRVSIHYTISALFSKHAFNKKSVK